MSLPLPPAYSICNLLRTLSPTLTATTEDPEFPASKIADNRAGVVAKLTGVTGHWVAQFTSPPTVDFASVHNVNLPDGATLIMQSSPDGYNWTDQGTFDLTDAVEGGAAEAWVSFDAVSSVNYWRLRCSANPSGSEPVRVGEWWLGSLTTLSRPAKWDFESSREFGVQGYRTEYGISTQYTLSNQRSWSMDMRDHMEPAQQAELVRMVRGFRGGGTLGLFIPDTGVATECALVRWNQGGYTHQTNVIDSTNARRYSGLGVYVIEDSFEKEDPRA